jgi:hypothetical protein
LYQLLLGIHTGSGTASIYRTKWIKKFAIGWQIMFQKHLGIHIGSSTEYGYKTGQNMSDRVADIVPTAA